MLVGKARITPGSWLHSVSDASLHLSLTNENEVAPTKGFQQTNRTTPLHCFIHNNEPSTALDILRTVVSPFSLI